jgi:Ca2+-binding RTX toxin-like protein
VLLDTAPVLSVSVQFTDQFRTSPGHAGTDYYSGEDVLGFVGGIGMGDITGAYDPTSGTLNLSSAGGATLQQWQTALRAVTYTDVVPTGDEVHAHSRLVMFTAWDGQLSNSAAQTVLIYGGDGPDHLIDGRDAGGGDDVLIWGGSGTLFDGGAGFNTLDLSHAGFASIALSGGGGGTGGGEIDLSWVTITNIQSVIGSPGADTLTAGPFGAVLRGQDGADSIVGGAGFNQINGNKGDDTIVGHSQVGDWLLGGQGNDLIEATASTGGNILNGNLGNDTISGGSGADSLRGGQGDDVIHAGSGSDWISGDLGSNTIYGAQGMDTFHAGGGHDAVSGWHNGDHVQVDSGVTYRFSQVSADVRITFSNGGEMDLLNTQEASLQSGWIG